MNRRPNLIAPVIIVACGLIVAGGIGTALSENGDSAATAAFRTGLPKEGTAAPAAAIPGATAPKSVITIGTAVTGAGGAANETEPAPSPTPANWTAGVGAGAPTATGTGCGAAIGTIAGTVAPAGPVEGTVP